LTNTERSNDILIRARQAHDDVAADPDRFRPAAAALVAEARRARQPEALALALRALAWAERARLDDRSAIRLLDEACRIARRHHLGEVLGELLMSHAAVSQELGRMTAARRDLRAAAMFVTGQRRAELDFHQAVLLQNVGQLAEAAAIYRRLLPGSAPSGVGPPGPARPGPGLPGPARTDPAQSALGPDRRRAVLCANNLAMIEAQQGRYGQALPRLDQALSAAVEVGPALVALVAESRAWVTVQSGRFAEGLRLFEAAAQTYQAAGLPLGEHYVEYADALMELRLLPEAAGAARQAVAEFSAAGVSLMAAEAQLRVAQLALLAGDSAEALAASMAAAATFRRQTRPAWRARTLLVTAEARLRSGAATQADLAQASMAARRLAALGATSAAVQGFLVTGRLAASLSLRGQAIGALSRAGWLARGTPVLVRLRGRVALALAAGLRHRDREALAHCRAGLSDLSRYRRSLPSAELRALASGHGAELGLIGLDVVIRDGSPARVLNWMERSRAAALLAVEPPEFDEIRADLTALRAVHAGLRSGAVPAARLGDLEATPAALITTEQAVIENRIRQATWRADASAGVPAGPVTVGALRELLAGRAFVAYGLLRREVVAVVIEPRSSRIVGLGQVEPVREQVRALLFALRRLAQPHPVAELAAARASADLRIRRLTELLVAPLRLAADLELVVAPVPGLHGVPWPALHGGPVCLAPSATFWARSAVAALARPGSGAGPASAGRAGDPGSVVLVAGPDLPGAVSEVELLAAIHETAVRIMPPNSTADRVASALAGADLAHLACHGTLRVDNPMFSSLLLSDGPLTVQELYARGLVPHRLILAACEAGAAVSYAGDEVLGFVSALLARGTAGILASTAVVPDVEAVGLMTAVHRQLARGATLARALHAARQAQDTDDPGSFVNWCTFSAHGAA
jgi:tetratricopeptide (TPR) repeat protein